MLRETGNVRWTYACHHRIIESFSQRQVIFIMPSLLASVSRKCASLLKGTILCEGVRDNGRIVDRHID